MPGKRRIRAAKPAKAPKAPTPRMEEFAQGKGEKVYQVPATFFQDHVDRHNNPSELIERVQKSSGNKIHVRLTDDQVDGLHSDAAYYAEGGDDFDPNLKGVVKSAQATVRALNTQRAN